MKIYSMTATFGKLEHETLTLQPGLNVIDRPNEWGKSTWCAFLVNMLYGLDTRAKSTRSQLAEKDKYAPWSGSPMAGRIDLNWNGRDITIERQTKGRIPMGEFRAYETESGLPVPELTAQDCGRVLLGVERSVFTRAGFIRLSDMPVTQDDALRRRLNALVTTGDESGAGEKLAQKLKDLKNRCRYNRTGLLPQAEAEAEKLEEKLAEMARLRSQKERLIQRQGEVEERLVQLENHKIALRYNASRNDEKRVEEARATRDRERARLQALEEACAALPSREVAEQSIRELTQLNEQLLALQMEHQMLPAAPEKPVAPAPFADMTPEQAVEKADSDEAQVAKLKKKRSLALLIPGLLTVIAAVALIALEYTVIALGCAAIGMILLTIRAAMNTSRRKQLEKITAQYEVPDPVKWQEVAKDYADAFDTYSKALEEYEALKSDLQQRTRELEEKRSALTDGAPMQESMDRWKQTLDTFDACGDLRRDLQRMDTALTSLEAMLKPAEAPKFEDELTYNEAETARLWSDSTFEQRQLQLQLGKCEGMIESLGSEAPVQEQLQRLQSRIQRLEETYGALDYAQKALAAASQELQRRFAPRIAKQARSFFGDLTGGRYKRLTLGEDLSLSAAAEGEDTLHASMWRSDGTVDQLYLALRLAVAEELTPEAPVILDDALVRFDDGRLAVAMKLLQQEGERKQVILFTCQNREKALL